jgi:hypothetical protein
MIYNIKLWIIFITRSITNNKNAGEPPASIITTCPHHYPQLKEILKNTIPHTDKLKKQA